MRWSALTPEVVRVLGKINEKGGFGYFRGLATSSVRIGVGDVVGVTILEASPGGLFILFESANSVGNFGALPEQKVDSAGAVVSVPCARRSIRVAGARCRSAVHRGIIEQRLGARR